MTIVRVRRTCAALLCLLASGCFHRTPPPSAGEAPESVTEAYDQPSAALMWPGATRAFQVTENGDLFNGVWRIRVTAEADGDSASPPRLVAYEHRWCPIVRWTRTSGDIRWDFEAVARPQPSSWLGTVHDAVERAITERQQEHDRRDENAAIAAYPTARLETLLLKVGRPLERSPSDRQNLFVSLRISARNLGQRSASTTLGLEFAPPSGTEGYTSPDSLVRTPWESGWGTANGDSVLGWCPTPTPSSAFRTSWRLEAGAQRSTRVILPVYPTPFADLQRWSQCTHEQDVEATRTYWWGEVNRGAEIILPDSGLCDAIRAARVILLSLRERRGVDWVPIGGPFHYRGVWLRDGARAMQALALSGYTGEAQSMAHAFLRFQWPHGPFVSQSGQLDGTGQALWAFEQVTLRPRPARDVEAFARAGLLACRGFERQRATTGSGKSPIGRLLPASNPHDNELIDAQLVGNDAWALRGYRATSRLARAAGMTAQAAEVERAEQDYARTFRDALDRERTGDIPPAWTSGGTDWGNLAVGYPCEVLAARDPRLGRLARRYWAPAGGAGPGYYRNPDSLHSYVAADLGTWALLAGAPGIADSVLDGLLEWRTASGGAAEMFCRSSRRFGTNYPPHPTSAAALLVLVRNSLVFDDTDTLQLTLGARDDWWSGTTVRRAPTRWGNIDLSIVRNGGTAEWRWTGVPVWTSLTLPRGYCPEGKLPVGARVDARGTAVLVPPNTTEARIHIAPLSKELSAAEPR